MVSESASRGTWLSAFPWVSSSVDHDSMGDIDLAQYLDETPAEIGSVIVANLGALILERMHKRSFFEIFPQVPASLSLDALELSAREVNLFSFRDMETFDDLGALTTAALLMWRNSGVVTVTKILECLCWANIHSALELGTDLAPETAERWSENSAQVAINNPLAGVAITHLTTLAEWQVVRGEPNSAILDTHALAGSLPALVETAKDWLLSASASTWLGVSVAEYRLAQIIGDHMAALESREVSILMDRILSKTPATLDALGVAFGVTRERVRQLESRLIGLLRSWVDTDTKLGSYSVAVRQRINKLSKLSNLLGQMPELEQIISGTDMPAWYILDVFDTSFESDGEWIAEPSLSELKQLTVLAFQEAETAPGIAPYSDLQAALQDRDQLSDSEVRSWLMHCGYSPLLDHFISADIRSIPELAFAYLHITGAPASIDEMHARVFPDRSARSARNAIFSDPRMIRVGQSDIGLREWGAREYSGIRDAIDAIISSQVQIKLDDLIINLTTDFDVSPRSIITYAGSWPFETINGVVQRAGQVVPSSKPLSQTRNIYCVDNKLRLVFKATTDHLRGSGFAIATSLASALGLIPGTKRSLSSSPSPITLSWMNAQPSLGSIRAQLLELDGTVGESIAIDLNESSATVSKLREAETEDLRARIGLEAGAELERSIVASALFLSPSAPWAVSIQALRDRGASVLADQIVAEIGSNPAYGLAQSSNKSKFRIISIDESQG